MKYWAYALVGLLLASSMLAARSAHAAETWYSGEGAEKGLLMKYSFSHIELKGGEIPITMTLWLGSQDDKGNWITDVIIEDEGEVTSGQVTLSAIDMSPIGFIEDEALRKYVSKMKEGLTWLSNYVSKVKPRPLSNAEWGRIASIGGGGIVVKAAGTETITAAGKSWDTSIVSFHYSEDSTFWVKDGFPIPIQAKVLTLRTDKPIPVWFEFKLLETRMSDTAPEPPKGELKLPTSPLRSPTTSGTYLIDLHWQPVTIEPGKPVRIGVVFFDSKEKLIRDAQYSMVITDENGKEVFRVEKKVTEEGQGVHDITFESGGKKHVEVIYHGSLGIGPPERIIEKATFDLIVVPEFPFGVAAVLAAVVGTMIAMMRFKKLAVPKL